MSEHAPTTSEQQLEPTEILPLAQDLVSITAQEQADFARQGAWLGDGFDDQTHDDQDPERLHDFLPQTAADIAGYLQTRPQETEIYELGHHGKVQNPRPGVINPKTGNKETLERFEERTANERYYYAPEFYPGTPSRYESASDDELKGMVVSGLNTNDRTTVEDAQDELASRQKRADKANEAAAVAVIAAIQANKSSDAPAEPEAPVPAAQPTVAAAPDRKPQIGDTKPAPTRKPQIGDTRPAPAPKPNTHPDTAASAAEPDAKPDQSPDEISAEQAALAAKILAKNYSAVLGPETRVSDLAAASGMTWGEVLRQGKDAAYDRIKARATAYAAQNTGTADTEPPVDTEPAADTSVEPAADQEPAAAEPEAEPDTSTAEPEQVTAEPEEPAAVEDSEEPEPAEEPAATDDTTTTAGPQPTAEQMERINRLNARKKPKEDDADDDLDIEVLPLNAAQFNHDKQVRLAAEAAEAAAAKDPIDEPQIPEGTRVIWDPRELFPEDEDDDDDDLDIDVEVLPLNADQRKHDEQIRQQIAAGNIPGEALPPAPLNRNESASPATGRLKRLGREFLGIFNQFPEPKKTPEEEKAKEESKTLTPSL